MKLSTLLSAALLTGGASSFSLNMNGRSPLSQQYKSIMSIHSGLTTGGMSSYPRMAPPPGEPEPEVRFIVMYILAVMLVHLGCVFFCLMGVHFVVDMMCLFFGAWCKI